MSSGAHILHRIGGEKRALHHASEAGGLPHYSGVILIAEIVFGVVGGMKP